MDLATGAATPPSPKPLALLGRDEMNLAEFPITLLTDRVPKDQKEAIYQDEIYDERTALTLSRKLTISAGNYGLTTAVDDEVILALIQLTKHKSSFTDRKVNFTRLELIRFLGWPEHGASYERILLSLQKWTSVYLQYENAWRDNRSKTWRTLGFHIIESFELNDSRTTGDQLDLIPSYIVWNQVIFESFQAGYLKPLDYDLCMGLSNSTAKRLYRFLDKRFHHKSDWTFDLKELAHEHIGLSRNYEGNAHLKRKLEPAISELETIGFLLPLPAGDRFPKNGRTCKVRLIQKSPALATPPQAEPFAQLPSLVIELVNRGVTEATAVDLVKRHQAEAIEHQIDVFDWLIGKQDKRVAKSPAGYLVKSIDTSYKQPAGFVSRAERQAREEATRQAERKAAAKRRQEQEADARTQAEKKAINAYWESLTPQEQAKLDAIVNAQVAPAMLALETGALKSLGQMLRRNDHIRQLLQNLEPVAIEA
jgi:Replication initiator protein A